MSENMLCFACCNIQKSHNLTYAEEDVMFFEHQLDLFGKLAYVSNTPVHHNWLKLSKFLLK